VMRGTPPRSPDLIISGRYKSKALRRWTPTLMAQDQFVDYYELLQVSSNADPEMVHRVYRLLAQRYHPDNNETGNATQFRLVTEAYEVLSAPQRRAQYDVAHQKQKQQRWRLIKKGSEADNNYGEEQITRLTVLDVLYTRRRMDRDQPGAFIIDLEQLTGTPREHLEFTVWYLIQKKLVQRSDNSVLTITADGVEYLEQNFEGSSRQRRLRAHNA